MEIWVRSQDKNFFGEVKSVELLKRRSNSTGLYDIYSVVCKDRVLGNYRSEKRCIEVIDEIQALFKQLTVNVLYGIDVPQSLEEQKEIAENLKNGIIYVQDNNNSRIERYSAEVIIFEMPKE